MQRPAAAILREETRVRYLKIIAIFKIAKGVLLLMFGVSALFLNNKLAWMDAISDWVDDEALLAHGKIAHFVLARLQEVLAGGTLHAAGVLALFYAAVLLTEGIGVYMQQRWAEFVMIFATAALIPLEVRHLFHRPTVGAVVLLLANCFIVWFLYRVLRREPVRPAEPRPEVAVEV
ncbi:MAG: DUF2127 domain-containing protein [Verrucomicrobia bacterium]|nr:DUF2127 domain-containing protein [Verrucomicrobiota bacterium]